MSVVNPNDSLTINGGEAHHLKKVKEEVNIDDDEAEQRQEEDKDEDEMTIPKLMSSRRKTTLYEDYDRSEAEIKRLRFSTVELENVEIGSKGRERTSSEHKNAMERAKEFKGNLNPKLPSFIKLVGPSNVGKGCKMPVLHKFVKQHMPKHDESVVLVGENGEQHKVKFLVRKPAFGAGWNAFTLKHDLQENDALIFQLLTPCKFKVHIFRRDDLHGEAVDRTKKEKNLNNKAKVKKADARSSNESAHKNAQANLHKKSDESDNYRNNSHRDQTDNASSFVDFRNFRLRVNGVDIDSELSEDIRRKYYELCLSRKTYLHEHLLKTIKPNVAAGLITEIVEIADAIRGSHVLTSQDDFVVWEKTLEGLVSFGMDVEFLRSRLNYLLRLTLQSKQTPDIMKKYYEEQKTRLDEEINTLETKYNEARLELTRLQDDIKTQETSLNRLKIVKNDIENEIHNMKDIQRYNLTFQQVARAAW